MNPTSPVLDISQNQHGKLVGMKNKTKSKPTYTATLSDGRVQYKNQPPDNLYGMLPLGVYIVRGDEGTLSRTDGGDPWDGAKFHLQSGRTVIVRRD